MLQTAETPTTALPVPPGPQPQKVDDIASNGPRPQKVDIASNTVLLSLSLKAPGNTRKATMEGVEVDADKDMLKLSKDLLASPELATIKALDGEIRRWLYTRALPSMFRAGVYLLPIALLEEVDTRLGVYRLTRDELVEKFTETYPNRVSEAQQRLRSQFDSSNYPTADQVSAAFSVEWSYFTMGTPDQLSGLNRAIWEREKAKAERQWGEASAQVQQLLRASMAELVAHIVDRLSPTPEGKRKTFRDSMVANLRDFLQTFPARNVTNDSELAALVKRTNDLLSGIDAQVLRDSDLLRDSVQRDMTRVKNDLDTMLIDRPGRAISLSDDE